MIALPRHGLALARGAPAVRAAATTAGLYVLLLAVSALMLGPFIWMLTSSLKAEGDIFLFPPTLLPNPPRWDNYAETVQRMPFHIFTFNSFKIAVLGTVGAVLTCSLAAYAFARLSFPGRDRLFFVLLATMMVPGQVTFIPHFLIMQAVGWTNSHNALIVPHFFGGAFGTFLLRQFFLTLPSELEDAARIDGAGHFRIYWQIFVPLAQPALATLAVFVFMGSWNDLVGPVIYLSDREKMTLTVGLAMFKGFNVVRWHLVMAGAVINVIPILIIYVLAQKYFVQGVALSGIKG
ncbi:MAG TPA: carbohydrate ABC transporter permease [Chloroflexota bacterium]|jgi:ABC-type glycerol-3-phosphate transport system permease component|nr:carbohydrate ABC transporter permease [Chloroflexota bacterium]